MLIIVQSGPPDSSYLRVSRQMPHGDLPRHPDLTLPSYTLPLPTVLAYLPTLQGLQFWIHFNYPDPDSGYKLSEKRKYKKKHEATLRRYSEGEIEDGKIWFS